MLVNYLHNKKELFLKLCKAHGVKKMYAFGSSITPQFDVEKSDVDIVVEIDEKDPIQKGEKLLSLWDKLEEFFKRKVDLLTDQPIKNPYLRSSIERTKILIYDREGEKVLI